MSKQYRGKNLWKLPAHGRGLCPVCKRDRVKVLYELILSNKSKIKVCKVCKNKKIDSL